MCFTYSVPLQRVAERKIIWYVFYVYSVTHNPKRWVFAGFCLKKMPVYMQAAAEINRRAPQLLHPHTARVLETIRYHNANIFFLNMYFILLLNMMLSGSPVLDQQNFGRPW